MSAGSLQEALQAQGVQVEKTLHITATASLAAVMRDRGWLALSIRDLTSAVIWAGMPAGGPYQLSTSALPALPQVRNSPDGFEKELAQWQEKVAGRGISLAIVGNDLIRVYLQRFMETHFREEQVRAAAVLHRSAGQFRRAVQTLAAAGFAPGALDDTEPLMTVARLTWRHLELELPELFRVREDLWIDRSSFHAQDSAAARDLRQRIVGVLDRICDEGGEDREVTIAYHGFYFFTPPQWAWFQLMRGYPRVSQCFVVQRDSASTASDIWASYFSARWDMPPLEEETASATSAGSWAVGLLRDALAGRTVSTVGPPGEAQVKLVEYESIARFAQAWRAATPKPLLFAADCDEVERIVTRFGMHGAGEKVNLSELPLGRFLIAFHDCIEFLPTNGHAVLLSPDRLTEIAASRLVDTAGRCFSDHVSAFQRAWPYFSDCTFVAEWRERADRLVKLLTASRGLGAIRLDGYASDQQRLADATGNPLRLLPWCDLSIDEAESLRDLVILVDEMTSEFVKRAGGGIAGYFGWLKGRLIEALRGVPHEQQTILETRLAESRTSAALSAEGVVEAIDLVLGRRADVSLAGEAEVREGSVRELRSLDAFAFEQSRDDIHLANLSDSSFPAVTRAAPWPFELRHLRPSSPRLASSRDLLFHREQSAGQEALYLLQVALGIVQAGASLTLSWISDTPARRKNLSPLVSLLAALDGPGVARTELSLTLGGLEVARKSPEELAPAVPAAAAFREWLDSGGEVDAAIARLPAVSAASGFACPRRLALQWVLGPSGAFQATHHQQMLYGNALGALELNPAWAQPPDRVKEISELAWAHLTEGQRQSSLMKRRVSFGGSGWAWIYTLGGSRPDAATDPISAAYVAAENGDLPSTAQVGGGEHGRGLPLGTSAHSVCGLCPVRPRCGVFVQADS